MIHIHSVDESNVRLVTDDGLLRELYDSFSFQVAGYKFQPKFKMGIWDGYIRLINVRNSTAPKGLVPAILDWCAERDYKCTLDPYIVAQFKQKVDFSWESLKLAMAPRDFQEKAVDICIRKKRQIILSSTGSGKSLIIYAVIRAIQNAIDEKILLIVPSVSLVEQMYSDFKVYSKNDMQWNVEDNVHKIYSGQDKNAEQQVFISTWQSLQNIKGDYLEQFGAVLGDEVHQFEAKVATTIIEKCKNAFFRFGFTGTLKETKTNEMQLISSFGPVTRVSSTKDLQDQGILAKLKIKGIVLKHTADDCELLKGAKYADEISWIVQNKRRERFLTNLCNTREGNTLVLFQFVEKQGKPLYSALKATSNGRQVHFVYGGTDADIRENVRKICESHDNVIIVASYGVFSTGVSINNLHNIVFASPVKSKVRVLQSIGRTLRLHESKEYATLYDISDDLRGKRKTNNITLGHFVERYQTYISEGFEVEIKEYKL